MRDGIKILQLRALDFITENKLESEYNKYWRSDDFITGYTAIDFVIRYCQNNRDKIKEVIESV